MRETRQYVRRVAGFGGGALARVPALASVVSVFTAGCSGAATRCRQAYESQDWSAAVAHCQQAFHGGDVRSGALTASSHLMLRQPDQAVAVAKLLLKGSERATGLRTIGFVLDDRGKPKEARPMLEEALALDLAAGKHRDAASDAQALMTSYWNGAEVSAALTLHKVYEQEAALSGEPLLQARADIALADVWREWGDAERALPLYQRAAARLTRHPSTLAFLRLKQGILERYLDHPALARLAFREALAMAERAKVADVLHASLMHLAWAESRLGNIVQARHYRDRLDDVDSDDADHARATVLLADKRPAEAEAVLAHAARGGLDGEAKFYVPLARAEAARALGDRASSERHHRESVAAVERTWAMSTEPEVRAWILESRREPYRGLLDDVLGRGDALEALSIVESLAGRAILDALSTGGIGARRDPGGAPAPSILAGSAAESFEGALLTGLGTREVLIHVDGLDHTWQLHVRDGRVVATKLGPRAELEALRDAFRRNPNDESAAEALGRRILPAEMAMRNSQPLFLLPEGAFRRLPYAALLRGGRYLVENRPLAFVAGLQARGRCRPRKAGGSFLVMGDPTGDLPLSRREASWVAEHLGVRPLLGLAASGKALRSHAASVLHLASHGEVTIEAAQVVLSDGLLRAAEVVSLDPAPATVVLAACASSASRHQQLWGSMTAAFLVAGAQHVVGTLSSVMDESAFQLVRRFYEAGGATDPVGALAAAQRASMTAMSPAQWGMFALFTFGRTCDANTEQGG